MAKSKFRGSRSKLNGGFGLTKPRASWSFWGWSGVSLGGFWVRGVRGGPRFRCRFLFSFPGSKEYEILTKLVSNMFLIRTKLVSNTFLDSFIRKCIFQGKNGKSIFPGRRQRPETNIWAKVWTNCGGTRGTPPCCSLFLVPC